jgi:hypothetical protein
MVGHGHSKPFAAAHRIEFFPAHHGLEPGNEPLNLLQQPFPARRALVVALASHYERIGEHLPQPLQGAAHGGLAQEAAFCGPSDMPLLQQCMQRMQQIQIQIPYMHVTHDRHHINSLDEYERKGFDTHTAKHDRTDTGDLKT